MIEALQKVGISELAQSKVNKISGGQRQRVAIARAIVNKPSILLADEPTGALDSDTAREIMRVFADLNTAGLTVMIVTHDVSIAAFCRRQITIADGRILSDTKAGQESESCLCADARTADNSCPTAK